jgi:tetratricopeptide (TPR) repeat protein
VEIQEKSGTPDRLELARSHRHLGAVFQRQDSYRNAQTHYERAMPLLESSPDGDGVEYALLLRDLGQIYAAQENLAEAERTLGRSLAILERKLGATDLELLETRTSYETIRRALESSPASGL